MLRVFKQMLFIVLSLALITGCGQKGGDPGQKKDPTEKPAAEKAEKAPASKPEASKPTTEPAAGKPTEEKKPAEEKPEAKKPAEPTEDPTFTEGLGEDNDKPYCQEMIAADEAELAKNLPRLKEEGRRLDAMQAWVKQTSKLLEEHAVQVEEKRMTDLWLDYQKCREKLPQPVGQNPAECLALIHNKPELCDGLDTPEEQRNCRLSTSYYWSLQRFVIGWARDGFKAETCSHIPPEMQRTLPPSLCLTIARGEKCQSTGKPPANVDEFKLFCRAAKAGRRGEKCGGEFPPGSPACQLLQWASKPITLQTCYKRYAEEKPAFPIQACEGLAMIDQLDCEQGPPKRPLLDDEKDVFDICAHLILLRQKPKTCKGVAAADSEECFDILAAMAGITGDASLCDQLVQAPQRNTCRIYAAPTEDTCKALEKPGKLDDTPCRKVLFQATPLPHPGRGSFVRLKLHNPFDEGTVCRVNLKASGLDSEDMEISAERTLNLKLKAFTPTIKDVQFSDIRKLKIKTDLKCTWSK